MGFWLCQKHCDCEGVKPGCCKGGWQTTYCGSKFCSPAEGNMAPIEGEAASAVWAMEKCKFFLLGLPNFTLCLDHKPLISMLGPQEYLTIPNPRLMNCKLKSSLYTFTPEYIPGKLHVTPDCFSRRSDSPNPPPAPIADQPLMDISNVTSDYQNSCAPPSWVSHPLPARVANPAGVLAPLRLTFCNLQSSQGVRVYHSFEGARVGKRPAHRPEECSRLRCEAGLFLSEYSTVGPCTDC